MKSLGSYRSFVFDCDGVLLNSNQIKTNAFFEVALPFGQDAAEALKAFHVQNGGVSRLEKFKYFFEKILKRTSYQAELDRVLTEFGTISRRELMCCPETKGASEFLKRLPREARKIVVSGGVQDEVRDVLQHRGWGSYFHAIYGSPAAKEAILKKELEAGTLLLPGLFFGDSKLDFQVAEKFGFDFLFVSDYTEFQDWNNFFEGKRVKVISNLSALHGT